MTNRTYNPGKLQLYWQKRDATKVTIYHNGKKLTVVSVWLGEGAVDAASAFMEGWFGTADRNQWKYRVTFG